MSKLTNIFRLTYIIGGENTRSPLGEKIL